MWKGVKGTSIGSIFAPFTQQKLLEVSGKEEQWSSQTLNSMLLALRDVTSAKHSIEEQEPDKQDRKSCHGQRCASGILRTKFPEHSWETEGRSAGALRQAM